MPTVHDVANLVRLFVNDVDAEVYTDDVLIPTIDSAYETLQYELAGRNVVLQNKTADINLAANQTALSRTGSVVLPADFIAPLRMWEKPTGSSDKFVRVSQADSVPDVDKSEALRVWVWADDQILFIGSSVATTIRLEYIKTLPELTSSGIQLAIPRSRNYLAWSAAEKVNLGRGEQMLAEQAARRMKGELENILSVYTAAEQYRPIRRPGYTQEAHDPDWGV